MRFHPKFKISKSALKPIVLWVLVGIVVAVLVDPSLRISLFRAFSSGAVGDTATNLLGQVDAVDTPYFTSASTNNAPSARGLNSPDDIAVDSVNHHMFTTDYTNNRILVYDLDNSNVLVDYVADYVLGAVDFKTAGAGSASSSSFNNPAALTIDDGGGRLFVADQGNNRVLVFDVNTVTNGEGAIAVLGQENFTDTGADSAADGMSTPEGLAYDEDNDRLFVSDSTYDRVLIFDATSISSGDPAVKVLNQSTFGAADGVLNQVGRLTYDPTLQILMVWSAVHIDAGNDDLWGVSMYDVNQITNGEVPQSVRIIGTQGQESNESARAYDIAYDTGADRLFLSDDGNNRVATYHMEHQGILKCGTGSGCDATNEWGAGLTFFRNILSLVKDTSNDVIYAGTGSSVASYNNQNANDGQILRCATATGCDAQGDWTIAYDATSTIAALTFDSANGVLYASGRDDAPAIYRCAVSTGCDAQGDWTVGYSLGGVVSFTIDTTQGVLYGLSGGTNEIIRCVLSTGCDGDGDWTTMAAGSAGAMTFDAANGVLYANAGSGSLLRCDTATNCDDAAEWVEATNLGGPVSSINALAIDAGGVLFIGTSGSAANQGIFRCDTSTACDAAEDFALAYDIGNDGAVYALTIASGFIYAGTGHPDGAILRCDLTSNCDVDGDWSVVAAPYSNSFTPGLNIGPRRDVLALLTDAGGSLYAGTVTSDLVFAHTLGQSDGAEFCYVGCNHAAATTQSGLSSPFGVFYEASDDTLYVADGANNRVMVWNTATITNGEPAVAMVGQLDENDALVYTAPGVNDTPNAQGFSGTNGVAIDKTNHRLYVVDTNNNRVLVFELDSSNNLVDRTADVVLGQETIKTVGAGFAVLDQMSNPSAVAVDETGHRLFVSDTNQGRVLVFDTSALANGMAATEELGVGDSCDTTCHNLINPAGLAYDPDNNRLFVADTDNARIAVYAWPWVGLVHLPVNVIGKDDYAGGGSNSGQNGISGASGLALDATTQRLFVTDSGNSRVMVFDVDPAVLIAGNTATDGPNAINVIGQNDYIGVASAVTQDGLTGPWGLAVDEPGQRLFVVDGGSHRVLTYNIDSAVLIPNSAPTNGPNAIDIFGQSLYDTNSSGATATTFQNPSYVAYDSGAQRIYVADNNNNRVMIFGAPPAPTPTPTPTPTPGAPPAGVGFLPERIVINNGDPSVDTKNVQVTMYASFAGNFTGTIEILLSNDPEFSTFKTFRYKVTDPINDYRKWPVTVPWDLCFGLPARLTCNPGNKIVYARYYVNTPAPTSVFTPMPTQ